MSGPFDVDLDHELLPDGFAVQWDSLGDSISVQFDENGLELTSFDDGGDEIASARWDWPDVVTLTKDHSP